LKKLFIPVIVILFLILFPVQQVFAEVTVEWQFNFFSFSIGGVGEPPIIITVTDSDLASNQISDAIEVQITSSVDQIGITLFLTEIGDDGIFQNSNLILMEKEAKFRISDTATYTLTSSFRNVNPEAIDMIVGEISVASSTFPLGITIDLIETGVDTSTFTAIIKFSNTESDPASATILAKEGDVISAIDFITSNKANGLIIPSSPDIGAILGMIDGNVIATYSGVSDIMEIVRDSICGRGCLQEPRPTLMRNEILVGGELIPVDNVSLVLAYGLVNSWWMAPIGIGIGVGIYLVKRRF